jgi:hypothetical protein
MGASIVVRRRPDALARNTRSGQKISLDLLMGRTRADGIFRCGPTQWPEQAKPPRMSAM